MRAGPCAYARPDQSALQGRKRMENAMVSYSDAETVLPLLAEIAKWRTLLADNHNGGFRVWTYIGKGQIGSGPFEVPWADLHAINEQHPYAVFIHGGPVVYRPKQYRVAASAGPMDLPILLIEVDQPICGDSWISGDPCNSNALRNDGLAQRGVSGSSY